MPDDFLSEKEAADYLGRSIHCLRDWRQRGTGPGFFRMVGGISYSQRDLDAFIASCRVEPKAAKEETTD